MAKWKRRNRKSSLCLDCKCDPIRIGEFYYVNLHLWMHAVGSKLGMLCISCLEKRIGRKLKASDFTPCYINSTSWGFKSEKLLSRLRSL